MTETSRKTTPTPPILSPSLIAIGEIVKDYGRCAMVGWISGERYYWFIDLADGSVSMIPADEAELHRREGGLTR